MRSPSGLLVAAKAPVAGRAKTRLAQRVGPEQAAEVAAAALLDTLDAGERAFPPGCRVLALSGTLRHAARCDEILRRLRGWAVVRQRGRDFGERLANAHLDAAALVGGPVIQVGMDTPHVTGTALRAMADLLSAGTRDAVLAPAVDGGWWALGVRWPALAECLRSVETSTSHTAHDTYEALQRRGASVFVGSLLRDVDEHADAVAVSAAVPDSRFARAWANAAAAAYVGTPS